MVKCSDCGFYMQYASDVSFCPSCGGDNIRDLDD